MRLIFNLSQLDCQIAPRRSFKKSIDCDKNSKINSGNAIVVMKQISRSFVVLEKFCCDQVVSDHWVS